ncbi:hypothetical protein AGMMS49545_10420 [Betaproteobacteria bacterium]|nr:hypothetical protein AGMMS49545_10420 [Betaproteobacteria bacterium]GHU44367.1 hypothetical protein AGMMS50289_12500 [Betaproteobacteria bacterium]
MKSIAQKSPTKVGVHMTFSSMENALDSLAGIVLAADVMLLNSPVIDEIDSEGSGTYLLQIAFDMAKQLRDFVGAKRM